VFKVSNFFIDNELVYQQVPGNAPVNIPALMGKHRLSYEAAVFKKRLKLAGGIEVRYNTAYNPAGYSAILNRFYYQGSRSVANVPEAALFVNFKIKRFRAFIMGDNMQQIFTRNAILFTGSPVTNFGGNGTTYTPVYAAPDVLIRFGFNWVMVN
jgi:hypothetical protein